MILVDWDDRGEKSSLISTKGHDRSVSPSDDGLKLRKAKIFMRICPHKLGFRYGTVRYQRSCERPECTPVPPSRDFQDEQRAIETAQDLQGRGGTPKSVAASRTRKLLCRGRRARKHPKIKKLARLSSPGAFQHVLLRMIS